jgi:uncharacterized membrane protein YozB (DUF420 family)
MKNQSRIKDTLVMSTVITWAVFWVVYLIKTFVVWEFTNPFTPIIRMPYYSTEARGFILFFWVFFKAIVIAICYDAAGTKTKENVHA